MLTCQARSPPRPIVPHYYAMLMQGVVSRTRIVQRWKACEYESFVAGAGARGTQALAELLKN